jgi:hypothetical protein
MKGREKIKNTTEEMPIPSKMFIIIFNGFRSILTNLNEINNTPNNKKILAKRIK